MADGQGQTIKKAMEQKRFKTHTDSNLLPASIPGWFKERPDSLKDLTTKDINPKLKLAIERAKQQKKIKQMPIKPYLDEVIVLGERVVLNEEGISASVLKESTEISEIIYFTPFYFPNEKNLNKIIQAKGVYSKVFAPGTTFGIDNPVPPCEPDDYNLLKEGLDNRLYALRLSLPNDTAEIVSMNNRALYEKAEHFTAVIKAIEMNSSICTNYELNFNTGKNTFDKYAYQRKPIDKEQYQNLLRQFAFLVLQSIHPIPGHEEKIGDITPEFLISALNQQQISKPEMDSYIAEYAQTADNNIPDIIAQTLEATDSQSDIYKLMVESEMQKLIEYIKKFVSENLKDKQLKIEFTESTKDTDLNIKDQLLSVVKWVLKKYTHYKNLLSKNLETISANRISADSIQNQLSSKQAQIFTLESELYAKTRNLDKITVELNKFISKADTDTKEKDEISNNLKKSNEELRQELAKRSGERDLLKVELDDLRLSTAKAIKETESAKGVTNILGKALNIAAKPQDMAFITKVEKIAKAVENNEDPNLEINSPFEELYNKFADHKKGGNQLIDICYLNYFVSFFITKLFSEDNALYIEIDSLIDTFLKSFEDIDTTMQELLDLLEIVESPSVKGLAYYVISKNLTPILKKIYALVDSNSTINTKCNTVFMNAFGKFLTKYIYFVPPNDGDPIQRNGFFIRPLEQSIPDRIDIYEWTGVNFKLTDKTISKSVLNNKSLPYPTLFILYVIFSKKYLMKKEDKSCPLPKFFNNPELLKGKKLKQANVVNTEIALSAVETKSPVLSTETKSPVISTETKRSRTVEDVNPRESPQDINPRESPQDIKPRESPQDINPRESPQDIKPRESPQDINPRESPQNIKPRESPQDIKPRESPQDIKPRESPQEYKQLIDDTNNDNISKPIISNIEYKQPINDKNSNITKPLLSNTGEIDTDEIEIDEINPRENPREYKQLIDDTNNNTKPLLSNNDDTDKYNTFRPTRS